MANVIKGIDKPGTSASLMASVLAEYTATKGGKAADVPNDPAGYAPLAAHFIAAIKGTDSKQALMTQTIAATMAIQPPPLHSQPTQPLTNPAADKIHNVASSTAQPGFFARTPTANDIAQPHPQLVSEDDMKPKY